MGCKHSRTSRPPSFSQFYSAALTTGSERNTQSSQGALKTPSRDNLHTHISSLSTHSPPYRNVDITYDCLSCVVFNKFYQRSISEIISDLTFLFTLNDTPKYTSPLRPTTQWSTERHRHWLFYLLVCLHLLDEAHLLVLIPRHPPPSNRQ